MKTILRDLVGGTAPVLSAYLRLVPAEPDTPADDDNRLRWRALADIAIGQGADLPTVEAVGSYLDSARPGDLALYAADGSVRHTRPLPGGVPYDRVRFGAPALVAPVLAWRQRHPAYVVVVTDRAGADITGVPEGLGTPSMSIVDGPDDEIRAHAPRGFPEHRYQHRAEDSWQHNAAAVAQATAREVHRLGGRLVLVAGDVRAAHLLREQLATDLPPGVVLGQLPGGRGADGSADLRVSATAAAVAGYVRTRTVELVKRFIDTRGPTGTSVEGIGHTLRALAEGQVDTLLVADDPADTRTAWFGPDVLAAADRGVDVPFEGRLVDVAVRAALLTRATVNVLDADNASEVADGIGGLCRY